MANELTPQEEQELKEEQQELLQDSVENQREAVEQSSKFSAALENLGSDARKKLGDTVSSIKESATSTLKSIPDLATAGIQDPALRTLAQGAVSGAKALPDAARYTKGLFTRRDKGNQKPEKTDKPSRQQERLQQTTNQVVQSVSDQNPTLEAIRANTSEMKTTLANLMSFMKGDSLDKLEIRREEQRRNEQILTSLQSIEGSAGFGGMEGFDEDFFDQQESGITGIIQSFKDKIFEIIGILGTVGAAFKFLKNRSVAAAGGLKNISKRAAKAAASSRVGQAAGQTTSRAANAVKQSSVGRTIGNTARGARSAIIGGGGPSTAAAAAKGATSTSAATGGGTGAAAIKYPRLMKFVSRIKGIPLLTPLVAGIQGIMIASNDEMPEKQKKEELSALLAGTVSGAAGAKLGAVLGGLFGGGIGAIPGALAGGLGGFFLGDYVGRKLAGFLLENPTNEAPPLPGTENASETAPNTPRGSAGPLGGSSASTVESATTNVSSATQNFETRRPNEIRSELETAREKLKGRAANIEDRKEVESLERELKSAKLEREQTSASANNIKISENDSYSSQEISQVSSRLMSTRAELIKQFNNAESSSEKKELKTKLSELPGISTISRLERLQTMAYNSDSDTVVAPMVSNVLERINSVSSSSSDTVERQQQQVNNSSSSDTVERQQQRVNNSSSSSSDRINRYSSEIERATSTMSNQSRASQVERDVQSSDIERKTTKTRLDAQRISSLYVQNQKQGATSIFVTPRARSLEIDRVETDRRTAAEEASQRVMARNGEGRQGSTNISTNVVNNSQGVIKNKPSAGSEPDNVSDTVMNSWAP